MQIRRRCLFNPTVPWIGQTACQRTKQLSTEQKGRNWMVAVRLLRLSPIFAGDNVRCAHWLPACAHWLMIHDDLARSHWSAHQHSNFYDINPSFFVQPHRQCRCGNSITACVIARFNRLQSQNTTQHNTTHDDSRPLHFPERGFS